jgi:hypothetical protein
MGSMNMAMKNSMIFFILVPYDEPSWMGMTSEFMSGDFIVLLDKVQHSKTDDKWLFPSVPGLMKTER